MTQTILVLEENIAIQLVIAVSLKESDIIIHRETNPELFVQQTYDLKPDLIFLSNSDSERNYKACREIRSVSDFKNTPIILLANTKDEVGGDILSELKINGLLRKPFEASMLQEQLSPFITLDENFGSEPYKDDEDFLIDMSTIDNQLKEIKQGTKVSSANVDEQAQLMDGLKQSATVLRSGSSPGSQMDSIILDNDQVVRRQADNSGFQEQESSDNENETSLDVLEENAVVEMNPVVEEIKELDEEPEQKLRQGLTEIDLAANDFEDPGEIWTKPPDLEQTLREGLTDISLDQTEFKPEYPKNLSSFEASSKTTSQDLEISKDSSEIRNELDDYELKQSLDENEVEAENQFDKMLLSDSGKESDELDMEDGFEFDLELAEDEFENNSKENESSVLADELESVDENEVEAEIQFDNKFISDSGEEKNELDVDDDFEFDLELAEDEFENNSKENESSVLPVDEDSVTDGLERLKYSGLEDQFAESRITERTSGHFGEDSDNEDLDEFVYETSKDEFDADLDLDLDDAQLNSMVHDSLNGNEDVEETALGELEELSEQMEALESDETEFEAEEAFEDVLEKEKNGSETITSKGKVKLDVDSKEYLADIMEEEVGELIGEDDLIVDDYDDIETEKYSDVSSEVHGEVFDSWDEAEEAFINFDRETVLGKKGSGFAKIDGIEFDNLNGDDDDFENSGNYSFTEIELKEIVSSSVHKALEKSIASSLVELAVSELKSQVTQVDHR
ncbi:MAG: hypothetical protein QGG68_06450 [SAR324 cluster bacterium]|nr:hypothetical protein [SAR324 cluster bacterium]